MKKIALVNHGCAKNLVDSELMLGALIQRGYEVTLDENESDIVIINTCSFIHDAETESVQSILRLANAGKKIIVTGCLPQKHKDDLRKAIPEITAMLGTTDFPRIADVVDNLVKDKSFKYISEVSDIPKYVYPENVQRQQITVGSSSYIKIADGCNYACGYCIIPKLRGPLHSRPMEKIVEEAKTLAKKGVSEIILIAQDTTNYGIDLYGKLALPQLLEELNKIEEIQWIRIMYAYPSNITDELIDAIAKLDKVVKYIDIPLQHSHPEVLRNMRRPDFDYEELIEKMRKKIPEIALRTAFIVGYPGETQEQFEHLYNFVEKMRFDKMGVFKYSREKNTVSYSMENQVPARVKTQRYNKLMKLQKKVSEDINKTFVGKTLPALIESYTSDGLVIARTYRDAPEVDGLLYIETDKSVVPGDIEKVNIVSSDDYDLYGKM